MQSTLNPEQTDPRNVFARVDEEIARAYEHIALADKQLSNLPHDAARQPSDPQTGMTAFRPAAVNNAQAPGDRPSLGRRALRGFAGFLLAACISAAAIAWQSSYGDAAKQIIARWAPQFVSASSPPLESPGLPEQPSPPIVQASAAEAALPQPAPLAQTASEGVAPAAAASPAPAQLLQSMARDLATVGQEIGQLKASTEQLKASIEQLKAGQEQMSRDIAKVSEAKASEVRAPEQNLRPRISAPRIAAPLPRPAAAPVRKPRPALSAAQYAPPPALPPIAAPPMVPQPEPQPQATVETDGNPVVRPPLPLR